MIPGVVIGSARIKKQHIVNSPEVLTSLSSVAVRCTAFPYNFVLKIVLPENLVEHYLHVMAGVPVAVKIKASGVFQNPRQLHTARTHEVDVSLCRSVAVLKRAPFSCLAPKDLVIPVGIERRINIDEVNAMIGFLELLQVIAAIDNPRVNERWILALISKLAYSRSKIHGIFAGRSATPHARRA